MDSEANAGIDPSASLSEEDSSLISKVSTCATLLLGVSLTLGDDFGDEVLGDL